MNVYMYLSIYLSLYVSYRKNGNADQKKEKSKLFVGLDYVQGVH